MLPARQAGSKPFTTNVVVPSGVGRVEQADLVAEALAPWTSKHSENSEVWPPMSDVVAVSHSPSRFSEIENDASANPVPSAVVVTVVRYRSPSPLPEGSQSVLTKSWYTMISASSAVVLVIVPNVAPPRRSRPR